MLRLPAWQIIKIEVRGIETLSAEEIKSSVRDLLRGEYATLIPKSSFFLAQSEAIGQSLKKQFLRIAAVDVHKEFPDELQISVQERKLWGIFCNDLLEKNDNTQCFYIDTNGVGYERAPRSIGSLILKIHSDQEELLLGEYIIEEPLARRMQFISAELKRAFGIETIGYMFLSRLPREIRVVTADGFQIYFNREDDFRNTFRVLKTVLEEEIKEKRPTLEYIDLRFGNKVFYKLRGKGLN